MFVSSLIEKVFSRNYCKGKDDYEHTRAYKRNRNFFLVQTISFFLILGYSMINGQPLNAIQKASIISNVVTSVVFLLAYNSYPGIFKFLYFVIFTLYGPAMLYYEPQSIYFLSISIFFLPVAMLYLIGKRAFMLQVIIQIIFLHLFYKEKLIISLNNTTPVNFAQRITALYTIMGILNAVLIFFIQLDLAEAQNHIALEKIKKMELERQKTFLLSFSHELRNLINTIIGATQLCLLENLPTRVHDLLNNSKVCGELLLHLVNNILDTGKVEIGELEINPVPNMVYETFEKVWGICSQLIKTKQLNGQIRIQENLPSVLNIDSYRLMQIMMNLIGNSIKFTERGSIDIDIQWIDGSSQIEEEMFEPIPFDDENEGLFEKAQAISLLNKKLILLDLVHTKLKTEKIQRLEGSCKGILKIIVTDTGCGIPEDKLSMLFCKFGQVSCDPSKRKLGTGLGLFITKELINRMKGEIRVYSRANQGTAFIVCIPVGYP